MIHLLVTAHHAGDLHYLPRLYTALRGLKKALDGQIFLLDSGQACSDQAWICEATEHRAPYMVMDAMGYQFAWVDAMPTQALERLQSLVQIQLITAGTSGTIQIEDQILQIEIDPILTTPVFSPQLVDAAPLLRLDLPPHGMIRQITLTLDKIDGLHSSLIPVTPQVLPDATIAATVDFVESEARYYQKRKPS